MELSLNNYINFLSLEGSIWGWFVMSMLLILVAQFRPFLVLSMMIFYPTVLWSASWKPFVTLYSIYPLFLFLFIRHIKDIFVAFFEFRHGLVVWLSVLIVAWSFMSPVLYPKSYGETISFSLNPNYQRGIGTLFLLFFIPAIIKTRDDIHQFFSSTAYMFMAAHILMLVAAIFFLLTDHPLYDLHLMLILKTPPIYWESGLFVLLLVYFLVNRRIGAGYLIAFCVLALFGLVLGNSRTRFVATFICMAYFIYPYINGRIVAWSTVLIILATSSLMVLPGVGGYFARLIDQRVEQSAGKSFNEMASGRVMAYEYTYNRWKEKPLMGVGSCFILPKINLINKKTNIFRVHNYYLEVLAGQGIVGFSLLIVVLVISLIIIFKIVIKKAGLVIDGRMIMTLFLFGTINWIFKESWGITYSVIALLSVYDKSGESVMPLNTESIEAFSGIPLHCE